MNDEIEWNPDKMLEVTIKQPDVQQSAAAGMQLTKQEQNS